MIYGHELARRVTLPASVAVTLFEVSSFLLMLHFQGAWRGFYSAGP